MVAMCPAASIAMNKIILKEGLYIPDLRCPGAAKRLWLLVIGTSNLRLRRRALR